MIIKIFWERIFSFQLFQIIKIRIAVPSTILNTGGRVAKNTFGGGGKRDGRLGGGEGGLGKLGGEAGFGGSAKDEFEFSSWPTPSSHCSQSMAAAAKEKVKNALTEASLNVFVCR